MNKPLVSVIIPTFRRPDTLDRAVNSVLAQDYPNVEVIVVDDNNPDTEGRRMTEKKMLIYKDEDRVRYIKHEFNKNGSAARNTGAKASNAEYVAFLDDDDEFLPKKISSQVDRLESLSEDWACCYSKYLTQKEDREPVESKECEEGYLFLEALRHKVSFAAGSNLLIRKNVFEEVGGFDETFLRSQDHELLTKIARKYKIAYCSEPGLIVHLHNEHKSFDYEVIIAKYIESFKSYIDELSESDRKEFYRSINNNRFYHFLRDKKDIRSCINMLRKREVTLKDACAIIVNKAKKYFRRRKNK